jgi:ribosomal protein S18 acetylase RimI-like enzyme
MACRRCENDAVYKCSLCGKLVCPEHLRFRTVCLSCVKKKKLEHVVGKVAEATERQKIRDFVKRFWGEQEQLTFGRKFTVAELPAYIANVKKRMVGFISFAESDDNIIIVALGILPQYQGSGIGRSLVRKVEAEAKRTRKRKLLVSTSNDDLPALAFYQTLGFQIFEVVPNVIAEKHGEISKGIGGLPVRDELRLQKSLR